SKYLMCIIMYFLFAGLIHVLSGVEGWEYRLEHKTLADYWKKYYLYYSTSENAYMRGSGVIGEIIARPVISMFNYLGSDIFFISLILIFSICVFDVSFFKALNNFTLFVKSKSEKYAAKNTQQPEYNDEIPTSPKRRIKEIDIFGDEENKQNNTTKNEQPPQNAPDEDYKEPEIKLYNKGQSGFADLLDKKGDVAEESKNLKDEKAENSKNSALSDDNKPDEKIVEELNVANEKASEIIEYEYPSIELLTPPKANKNTHDIEDELKKNSKKLVDTLKSFGVSAKVVEISMGPTVTRYELTPDAGVKVSKIVGLSKDIALNLAAKSVRIEAPIPGKSAVGIELANKVTNIVTLREVLESEEFKKAKSKLSVALGKDIGGNPIIIDIAKMPHLLIAGATGAGKSVCINTLVMSILYKADPNEVKLVMIDPKVVELGVYNGAPHLLIPVVTDAKKAAGALNWAVSEMTERYSKFADNNVRDINGYNELMELNETPELKMPQMVIIIDELADLMMVAPADVETYICRLAQMARAAGMHLVIATQRPSVNVITGTIKANIPSRISFMVSSQIDSRTILDMSGAEKLIGRGDMLYMPVGASSPTRLQCSYVSDKEVEAVVAAVSKNCAPQYKEDVIERLNAEEVYNPEGDDPGDNDELLPKAIELVIDAGQISTSLLQRRFRIGYNRAGSIIDQMEARGIISGLDGNKPRQALITREEYNEMLMNNKLKE
ncbi:MAG: DNA translocase FtsK, partial [Oscillospiraceae bacterium]|nr:DNA translocase FtsK [Oscillospiraceae bacterium]